MGYSLRGYSLRVVSVQLAWEACNHSLVGGYTLGGYSLKSADPFEDLSNDTNSANKVDLDSWIID